MRTDAGITPHLDPLNSRKTCLYSVCAISVLWIVGLLTMALCSTNLPVLNPRQIERATLIVTGTPINLESGLISIETVWKGASGDDKITIDHLSQTAIDSGERWIFSLVESERGAGMYSIAPYSESIKGHDPNRPQGLLIYPATPQLEQQLKSLLESGSE